MKKVFLALVAIAVMSCIAFAEGKGEINVKASLAPFGALVLQEEMEYNTRMKTIVDTKVSFGFAGEYLYGLDDFVKVGAGLEYTLGIKPKNTDFAGDDYTMSVLPIYASLQINPVSSNKEIFIKGNIGYVADVFMDTEEGFNEGIDGAVYWSVGAGYEFPFGLIAEISYSRYNLTSDDIPSGGSAYVDKYAINLGYKIKI